MVIEEVKHIDVHMEDKDVQLLEKTAQLLTTITEYMDDYDCEHAEYHEYGYLDCVCRSEIEEAIRVINHLTTLTSLA